MKLKMFHPSKALFHNNIHVESVDCCRESCSIEAHLERHKTIYLYTLYISICKEDVPDAAICCSLLRFPRMSLFCSHSIYVIFLRQSRLPDNRRTLQSIDRVLIQCSPTRTIHSQALSLYIKLLLYHISYFSVNSFDYCSPSDCLIHGKYTSDIFLVLTSPPWEFFGTHNGVFCLPWLKCLSGPRSPHCRGFAITLIHTTLGRTSLGERSARPKGRYVNVVFSPLLRFAVYQHRHLYNDLTAEKVLILGFSHLSTIHKCVY